MQLMDDSRQPVEQSAGSSEPSRSWIFGLTAVDDRASVKPAVRPYSYKSECECPDDCLRDHENE